MPDAVAGPVIPGGLPPSSGQGRSARGGMAARLGRQVREALADLLDQRTAFGRLALTHVLMTAGDTLLTVSLAGSLFFSISPSAAKSRVLLYLVLTMAPLALVAPFIGQVIDRSRATRRGVVIVSAAARAVVCVFLAGDLRGPLLFPEAFLMLVFSKMYLVTKGALVPLMAGTVPQAGLDGGVETGDILASLNARLGLLASLAGFAASLPAIVLLKVGGGSWVLLADAVVFAAATVAAFRLPIRRRVLPAAASASPAPAVSPSPPASTTGDAGSRAVHPEVHLARAAMSVLKGVTGFLTLFLAFAFRRQHAATWWFGLVLAASVAGALLGVLVVPRVRRLLSEAQLLTSAVWLVGAAGALAALVGGRLVQALAALLIGLAAAAGKPAFDALVQRYVPTEGQGRAFARFETWFQFIWVVGALIPVVVVMPLAAGDIVIAVVATVGGLFYLTARTALRHRRDLPAGGDGSYPAPGGLEATLPGRRRRGPRP